MKSNQRKRQTTAGYAGRHKRAVVESQPAAEAAVSRDPHVEEFDFGPHVAARAQQQLEAFSEAVLGGNVYRRTAVVVALVDVAALAQQQFEAVDVALHGGNRNRRRVVIFALVDVAARRRRTFI